MVASLAMTFDPDQKMYLGCCYSLIFVCSRSWSYISQDALITALVKNKQHFFSDVRLTHTRSTLPLSSHSKLRQLIVLLLCYLMSCHLNGSIYNLKQCYKLSQYCVTKFRFKQCWSLMDGYTFSPQGLLWLCAETIQYYKYICAVWLNIWYQRFYSFCPQNFPHMLNCSSYNEKYLY